jgi:Fe2+ or Zn2+ uptake regulation protein
MEPGRILEELFDRKTLSILKLFAANPEKQYYLREIAKATRVPIATVFRIMAKLVTMGVITEVKIKRFKLYQFAGSKEAKFVEQLIEIRKGAVEEFIEACRPLEGIQQVVLHGKKLKDKANLLIIGSGIAKESLNEAVAKIKEAVGFTILYTILEAHQYEQMSHMGLIGDDRQTLLQK